MEPVFLSKYIVQKIHLNLLQIAADNQIVFLTDPPCIWEPLVFSFFEKSRNIIFHHAYM